jgi:hypothetical protein
MAVQHITLFELAAEDGVADVDSILDQVGTLLANVPGVLGVSAGRNFTDRAINIHMRQSLR